MHIFLTNQLIKEGFINPKWGILKNLCGVFRLKTAILLLNGPERLQLLKLIKTSIPFLKASYLKKF
jgi:hypothetical protein